MRATTTRDPDTAEAPADHLEREGSETADRYWRALDEILQRLEPVPELLAEVRAAGAEHALLAVEAAVLESAHDDVNLDVEPFDREAALKRVEHLLEDVRDALAGEQNIERIARSAQAILKKLRQAQLNGTNPDEIEALVDQLRRRTGGLEWLDDELVHCAFLAPARHRRRDGHERRLVRAAVRTARSFGRGHPVRLRDEDGAPNRYPAPVVELIEEQVSDPRNFRSLFLDEIDNPTADQVSGRDLKAELAEVARELPDTALAEALR